MAIDAPVRDRTRRWLEPLVASVLGTLATVGVLLQLFLGPDVGLADNGDGFRLMCHFDLVRHTDPLFNPLEVRYDDGPGCSSGLGYFSSQQWLTGGAVEAFRLRFGQAAGFDLRAVGALHAFLFGTALALLYLALPGGRPRRLVTTVVAGVLLADITFVSYFVSPLSEPATFLGLLLVVAAAAWYVRAERRLLPALLALGAAGVFLSLAKSQTGVFAGLLVPVLLLRTVEVGRLRGRWGGRVAPALVALALLGVTAGNLSQQPDFYTRVNLHNLVFSTLLPQAPDPAGVLSELGADPGLARYSGTGYFSPGQAEREADPAYQAFGEQVSRADVLGYLAGEPSQWKPLLREGAYAAGVVRVHYMSNYREVRELEDFKAPRPNPTQALLNALGAQAWPLLPVGWLVVGTAGFVLALRRASDARTRTTGVLCYLLGIGALSQTVVALIGDGYYELVKHTVLSGFATGALLAVGLGALVGAVTERRGVPRGSGAPSTQDTDVPVDAPAS